MLSKTRGMPVHSAAPGVIPDTLTGPVSNGRSAAGDPQATPVRASRGEGPLVWAGALRRGGLLAARTSVTAAFRGRTRARRARRGDS
jgi:hypothetical protein